MLKIRKYKDKNVKDKNVKDKSVKNVEVEYKDDFSPDLKFLSKSVLKHSPKDGICRKTRLGLSVPAYVWDMPRMKEDSFHEQITSNMISLFLRDCSDDDHQRLINSQSYLRIFLYQDAPDSNPYSYSYIRNIEECTYPSHKFSLTEIKKLPGNLLPCEINFGNQGFFYYFTRKEWMTKSVDHLSSYD